MHKKSKPAPKGLQAHAMFSHEETKRRLYKAMAVMEDDIQQNDGVYPFNTGRVTQAEVLRRADKMDKSTLQGSAHNGEGGMRKVVNDWVKAINAALANGGKRVRKVITERVDVANDALQKVQEQCHIYKLEKQFVESELKKRDERIIELEAALVNALKITRIGKPRGPSPQA